MRDNLCDWEDNMKYTYKHTRYACYISYIIGAVINNFASLLFVVFNRDLNISLEHISLLITTNFAVQLVVDFLGAKYVDRIGYRRTLIFAMIASCAGLTSMGILPFVMPPFTGLIISVFIYAVGSGLLEVMVSPTIEALPSDAKRSSMSLLHSFYSWGSMFVIIASTLYFKIFGLDNWRYLCFIWALIPLANIYLFTKVPIIPFGADKEVTPFRTIFKTKLFWVFVVLMMSAGASEIAMSQWASLFAETGLKVSKTTGDLLGPCMFALLMGIGRLIYGKYGEKLPLIKSMKVSALICICGYLMASLIKNPFLALIGCGLCGFGVAIMWPGTLSLAAKYCNFGGTAIFGLLAMSGDLGCCLGPYTVAKVSTYFTLYGSELKAGLLFSIIFPVILIIAAMYLTYTIKNRKEI